MRYDDFQSTPHRAPFVVTDGEDRQMYGSLAEALEAFAAIEGEARFECGYGNVWFSDDTTDPEADFEGMEVLSFRLREYEAEAAAVGRMAQEYEGNLEAVFGETWRDLLDVSEEEILNDERGLF